MSIPSGGQKGKVLVQIFLLKIFRFEEFTSSADDVNNKAATSQVGSHSICKFAATQSKNQKCGCTCNEKDVRSQ
jgi:hypothetical protein